MTPFTRRVLQQSSARRTGFTLVEVLVTMGIVGLLAAFAIPTYRNYALRAQILEATNTLNQLYAAMQHYYTDNRTWNSATTSPVVPSPCDATALTPLNSSLRYFTISCVYGPNNIYVIYFANGKSGTPANGFTYTLNNQNLRETSVPTTSVNRGLKGWTAGTYMCWITQPGGSC